MERKYCASVYVVDFETEKTLLMYNHKIDKWLQPGGHIKSEIFELPSECAKRETLEETGYEIEIIGKKLCGDIQPFALGRYINKVGNMIDVQYVGIPKSHLDSNEEGNKIGFFSVDEMIEMNVDPEIIEKVRDILINYRIYVNN